ncbi:hypothetical protein ACTXT7_008265 [Hymenolepis weldensis]
MILHSVYSRETGFRTSCFADNMNFAQTSGLCRCLHEENLYLITLHQYRLIRDAEITASLIMPYLFSIDNLISAHTYPITNLIHDVSALLRNSKK